MTTLYEPAEEALLADFFGLPRSTGCATADTSELLSNDHWDLDRDIELRSAVARWTLGVIQGRLPQSGIVHEDGDVDLTRATFKKPYRDVVLLPQHLFTINRADSGPGMSWPEAYHATFIPGFDRYIVTASQDSTDAWGVTDLAIGHFPASTELEEGCRQVITEWWRSQLTGWEQPRFSYVWDSGLIKDATAYAWADEVWGTGIVEDDADVDE